MAEVLVPDTSVLVDGRISELIEREHPGADIRVPVAALAELEAQANRGLETGFTGLDELTELQRLAADGKCSVAFVGRRPSTDEIERAHTGAVDALIVDAAREASGTFVTSDRVAAHTAAAMGLAHIYLRPLVDEATDLTGLMVHQFFEDDVSSVHLKADCRPMAKRGKPGEVRYEAIGTRDMTHQEVRAISKECIEFAKRDYNSFVEMDRKGCTVVQLGPMRITLAQPPFSDAVEVTAVRPIFKATLADYDLPEPVRERMEGRARGVLVSGPPGSGKSTFAAAMAEHLLDLDRVVKTMEAPRDLQVPKEVTQYGPLDRDMAWTGEVMLLVRPDHVVYDEVRTTEDFRVYADMRLAGIGLYGVTHANRAIDAVQRLLGRVDLGMIPQVVDTVVFIEDGAIKQILELSFTVRVPSGMMQEDLARPVVVVKDFETGKEVYELYTFGEQIVVMPLQETARTGTQVLAERELERALQRFVRGPMEVELRGGRATVRVAPGEVPALIGKGGRTVQMLEKRLGVSLDIQPLERAAAGRRQGPEDRPTAGGIPVRRAGKNVFLHVGPRLAGEAVVVSVEGAIVGEATVSQQGKVRFKAASPEGQAVLKAQQAGLQITCDRA